MSGHYFYGIGRRKSSTARVRLQSGKGEFTVNGKPLDEYFGSSKLLINELNKPFVLLDMESAKFDISAVVSGGGHHGQTESIRLGIAKAIALMDESTKSTLRRAELLGRDPREKERKKFGLKGARKQRQFTKR